jgi:hypothetical protein
MAHQAKIYARIQSFGRADDLTDGSVKFNLEWIALTGARRQGKVTLVSAGVNNAEAVARELHEALATHLSTVYAPEQFRPRDIAGCTV